MAYPAFLIPISSWPAAWSVLVLKRRRNTSYRNSRPGRWGGIGLTEPDAGSDLQGIRLVAKKDGDDYVLNGTKTWIPMASMATVWRYSLKQIPTQRPGIRA